MDGWSEEYLSCMTKTAGSQPRRPASATRPNGMQGRRREGGQRQLGSEAGRQAGRQAEAGMCMNERTENVLKKTGQVIELVSVCPI